MKTVTRLASPGDSVPNAPPFLPWISGTFGAHTVYRPVQTPAEKRKAMPAPKDPDHCVDTLDRLVRIVRADALAARQLAVRAAFVGALASTTPAIVRNPGEKHVWTPSELAALARATTARLRSKHELHCVVGTSDFSVNVSYQKKSLVYLRADTNPPLRVLTYASTQAPKELVLPHADDVVTDKRHRESTKHSARVVHGEYDWLPIRKEKKENTSVLERRACAALDDDDSPDESLPTQKKPAPEQLAVARASRLRQALVSEFGHHWHVVSDSYLNPVGAAPGKETKLLLVLEKQKVRYVAWQHAACPLSVLQSLGVVFGSTDGPSLTLARRTFLGVVAAYTMWYARMCDETSAEVGWRGKINAELASKGVLARAERPLTRQLCYAAPRLAPFALLALTAMGGNYALSMARRIAGARVTGAKRRGKRKAA